MNWQSSSLDFFVISMESLQWEFGRTHICNKEVSLCFTNPGIGNYVYYICTLRRKNLHNHPSCPSVAWQERLQANQFPCSLCIYWRLVYPLLYGMQPELTYTSAVMQHFGSGIEGWHRWQLLFKNKNIASILIAYLYMLTKCICILLWDNILKDFIVINAHLIYSCISDFSDKDTNLKWFSYIFAEIMHFIINNLSTISIHNTVIICKQHLKRVNVILERKKYGYLHIWSTIHCVSYISSAILHIDMYDFVWDRG